MPKKTTGCLVGCAIVSIVGVAGFCLFFTLVSSTVTNIANTKIEDADKQYADGEKAEAIAAYKSGYDLAGRDEKHRAAERIILYEIENANDDEARRWAEKSIRDGLELNFTDKAAISLLSEVRENIEKQREAERIAAEKKQEYESRFGSEFDAEYQAKKFVKQKMQFPEETSITALRFVDPYEQPAANGEWTFFGELTTKNAFGVSVQHKWKCTLKKTGEYWTEINVELYQQ